jgi:hypothetical protein
MYSRLTQSIPKLRHVHQLITLIPGHDEMDTVVRCSSCGRIMLVEDAEDHSESCQTPPLQN